MRHLLLFAAVLFAPPLFAQELMDLLNKGPVVLVETNDKGRFKQATAVLYVDRPVAEVWSTAVDFARYKEFMPRVVRSDVKTRKDGKLDVTYEVEVPGSNTVYTFRYDVDASKREMTGRWVKGDIKGSECAWRMVPYRSGTLVYYTAASRNYSSLAESLEDDQQTVTVGVNVGAALATVRAIKQRLESAPAAAAAK